MTNVAPVTVVLTTKEVVDILGNAVSAKIKWPHNPMSVKLEFAKEDPAEFYITLGPPQ